VLGLNDITKIKVCIGLSNHIHHPLSANDNPFYFHGCTSKKKIDNAPTSTPPSTINHHQQQSSVFLTKEDLIQRNQDFNAQKSLAAEQSRLRKLKMEDFDHQRSQNAQLSELDQETKDKANYLLSKAQMQLEEQEDEIKHMNELMLYAKCVAIRDSQVEEKKMIHKEKKEEEQRLDMMMEMERVNELKKLEEREKRRIEGKKNSIYFNNAPVY
jgi:hypothetical protein